MRDERLLIDDYNDVKIRITKNGFHVLTGEMNSGLACNEYVFLTGQEVGEFIQRKLENKKSKADDQGR